MKLYKGKREWQIEQDGDTLVTTYGIRGGKQQVCRTISKDVNKDMLRKCETQKKKGYIEMDIDSLIKDIQYPCYIQKKMVGVPATFKQGKFYRTDGTPFETLRHLEVQLEPKQNLKGVLSIENLPLDMIADYCNKLQHSTYNLEFFVYDTEGENFADRWESLKLRFSPMVKKVETTEVNNREELIREYQDYLDIGHTGAIVRFDNTVIQLGE